MPHLQFILTDLWRKIYFPLILLQYGWSWCSFNSYRCFPSYLVLWHTPLVRHFLYILPLTSSLVSIRIYLSLFPPLKKIIHFIIWVQFENQPPIVNHFIASFEPINFLLAVISRALQSSNDKYNILIYKWDKYTFYIMVKLQHYFIQIYTYIIFQI